MSDVERAAFKDAWRGVAGDASEVRCPTVNNRFQPVTDDLGQTFTDLGLLTFLSPAADNGDPRQRVLGDYMQLKAVGNTFYGAFTGNGVAFGRPFANHDPIFFRVSVK